MRCSQGSVFAFSRFFFVVKCVVQVDTIKGGGRASYRGGIGGRQGRQHYSRHKKGVRIQQDYHKLLPLHKLWPELVPLWPDHLTIMAKTIAKTQKNKKITYSVGWTFSQNVSSLALLVWDWHCLEDIWTKGSVIELINWWSGYDCRTAPGTPGLLRETVPLQTSDMGKKTVSVLAHSFLLS